MAKKPSIKQILEAAAKRAATKIKPLSVLIPVGRYWQSVERRAKIYLDAFKVRIVRMMRRAKSDQMHGKKSLATLVPDLRMKKNEEGARQYRRLVRKYGAAWAQEAVYIQVRKYAASEVEVLVKKGRRLVVYGVESVPAYIETTYEFRMSGTTAEQLEWTEALGNKINVRLTGITAAYAAGLPRNAHKKKTP